MASRPTRGRRTCGGMGTTCIVTARRGPPGPSTVAVPAGRSGPFSWRLTVTPEVEPDWKPIRAVRDPHAFPAGPVACRKCGIAYGALHRHHVVRRGPPGMSLRTWCGCAWRVMSGCIGIPALRTSRACSSTAARSEVPARPTPGSVAARRGSVLPGPCAGRAGGPGDHAVRRAGEADRGDGPGAAGLGGVGGGGRMAARERADLVGMPD